jgi:hypothetical protein
MCAYAETASVPHDSPNFSNTVVLGLGLSQPSRGPISKEILHPAVRLHLAGAGRVHGDEVGIGDDDLVAQPLAVGRGLGQDPRPGAGRRARRRSARVRCGSAAQATLPRSQNARSAFLLVDVDAIWSMVGPLSTTVEPCLLIINSCVSNVLSSGWGDTHATIRKPGGT